MAHGQLFHGEEVESKKHFVKEKALVLGPLKVNCLEDKCTEIVSN